MDFEPQRKSNPNLPKLEPFQTTETPNKENATNETGNLDNANRIEKDNKGKGSTNKKKHSLFITLLPFPLNILFGLLLNKRSNHLLRGLITMIGGSLLFIIVVSTSSTVIHITKMNKLKQNLKEQKLNTKFNPKRDTLEFNNYLLNNQQLPVETSNELDYTKLAELSKTNSTATAQAQRYQLFVHIGEIFEINPLTLYSIVATESSARLNGYNDIYKEYIPHDMTNLDGIHGLFQISSQTKHNAFAFESKYSTRDGSAKDDSVLILTGERTGEEFYDVRYSPKYFPKTFLPSETSTMRMPTDLSDNPVESNSDELSMSKGINKSDTLIRGLTLCDNKGAGYRYGGSGMFLYSRWRPSIFYIPDSAYSQAVQIAWTREELNDLAQRKVNGENNLFFVTENENQAFKWSKEDCEDYLKLNAIQKSEIAFMYYCDWYLGSLTAPFKNAQQQWNNLGVWGIKVIDKYSSLSLNKKFSTPELWERIDGRSSTGAKPFLNNGKSLLEEFKLTGTNTTFYSDYKTITNGGGSSENYLAYTYAVRGMNNGYSYYLQDKEIYENAKKEIPINIPDTGNTEGQEYLVTTGYFNGINIYYPTDMLNATITSTYGYRNLNGKLEFHNGVDIDDTLTKNVYAFADGEIEYVGWYSGGGNTIRIKHSNGLYSIYMHMSSTLATVGTTVRGGSLIGYIGNSGMAVTGNVSGTHLHFGLLKQTDTSTSINPIPYLYKARNYQPWTNYSNDDGIDLLPNKIYKMSNREQGRKVLEGIVEEGLSWVGKGIYLYGGKNPKTGIDCSNFINWCYEKGALIKYNYMPSATLASQFGIAVPIGTPLQIGDLLVRNDRGHVMLYIGNNEVVHASDYGIGVIKSKVTTKTLEDFKTVRRAIILP